MNLKKLLIVLAMGMMFVQVKAGGDEPSVVSASDLAAEQKAQQKADALKEKEKATIVENRKFTECFCKNYLAPKLFFGVAALAKLVGVTLSKDSPAVKLALSEGCHEIINLLPDNQFNSYANASGLCQLMSDTTRYVLNQSIGQIPVVGPQIVGPLSSFFVGACAGQLVSATVGKSSCTVPEGFTPNILAGYAVNLTGCVIKQLIKDPVNVVLVQITKEEDANKLASELVDNTRGSIASTYAGIKKLQMKMNPETKKLVSIDDPEERVAQIKNTIMKTDTSLGSYESPKAKELVKKLNAIVPDCADTSYKLIINKANLKDQTKFKEFLKKTIKPEQLKRFHAMDASIPEDFDKVDFTKADVPVGFFDKKAAKSLASRIAEYKQEGLAKKPVGTDIKSTAPKADLYKAMAFRIAYSAPVYMAFARIADRINDMLTKNIKVTLTKLTDKNDIEGIVKILQQTVKDAMPEKGTNYEEILNQNAPSFGKQIFPEYALLEKFLKEHGAQVVPDTDEAVKASRTLGWMTKTKSCALTDDDKTGKACVYAREVRIQPVVDEEQRKALVQALNDRYFDKLKSALMKSDLPLGIFNKQKADAIKAALVGAGANVTLTQLKLDDIATGKLTLKQYLDTNWNDKEKAFNWNDPAAEFMKAGDPKNPNSVQMLFPTLIGAPDTPFVELISTVVGDFLQAGRVDAALTKCMNSPEEKGKGFKAKAEDAIAQVNKSLDKQAAAIEKDAQEALEDQIEVPSEADVQAATAAEDAGDMML